MTMRFCAAGEVLDFLAGAVVGELPDKQGENDLGGEERDSRLGHGFRHLLVDRRAVSRDVRWRPHVCRTMGIAETIAMTMIVIAKNFAMLSSRVDPQLLELLTLLRKNSPSREEEPKISRALFPAAVVVKWA